MEEIFNLLDELQDNFGMYIGNKSLNKLTTFISGYECAMNRLLGHYSFFNSKFQLFVDSFLGDDFHVQHCAKTLHYDKTEEEAFDLFYEVLEEFKKTL